MPLLRDLRASEQDGTYPRPQLVRSTWVDLCGQWEFEHDDTRAPDLDADRAGRPFADRITVPFPPESPASGIGRPGYHPVLWYRRRVTAADLAASGYQPGGRLLLHLGAVDYRADVWADGHRVATHEGGHTPFTADVTAAAERVRAGAVDGFDVVVRAEDDPLDVEQPRGKQDWEPTPHVIWYERTSGIWQPVWLEAVPAQHVTHLSWWPDVVGAAATLRVELAQPPAAGTRVRVTLAHDGAEITGVTASAGRSRTEVRVPLDILRNGQDYERFLWSPSRPTLLDAWVDVLDADGQPLDTVASYTGLRTVGTEGDDFLLNDRPHPVRAVLSQGYWPQSHLAAPSAAAIREEVELCKELGFTTARLHQKVEDPRFLFWADRLGLMVWGEMPSTFQFSATAVERTTREWLEVLRRDASHPSLVVWVPLNESWGVQQIAHDASQLDFARSLYHLTKAVDPTRLVIANDGWEHAEADLHTIHDYENDPAVLEAAYLDADAVRARSTGIGPGHRRITLLDAQEAPRVAAAPVVVSEFGGVSYDPTPADGDTWGYRVVHSADEYREQLGGVFRALHASRTLAGWCYTQLTDTVQETNGLTDEHRVPKLPVATIRAMVEGAARG